MGFSTNICQESKRITGTEWRNAKTFLYESSVKMAGELLSLTRTQSPLTCSAEPMERSTLTGIPLMAYPYPIIHPSDIVLHSNKLFAQSYGLCKKNCSDRFLIGFFIISLTASLAYCFPIVDNRIHSPRVVYSRNECVIESIRSEHFYRAGNAECSFAYPRNPLHNRWFWDFHFRWLAHFYYLIRFVIIGMRII